MLEKFSRPESADDVRRAFHLAQGIVMGLRRTDQTSAFSELITTAHIHGVTVRALADALIDLVEYAEASPTDSPAHRAALQQWGFDLRALAHG